MPETPSRLAVLQAILLTISCLPAVAAPPRPAAKKPRPAAALSRKQINGGFRNIEYARAYDAFMGRIRRERDVQEASTSEGGNADGFYVMLKAARPDPETAKRRLARYHAGFVAMRCRFFSAEKAARTVDDIRGSGDDIIATADWMNGASVTP